MYLKVDNRANLRGRLFVVLEGIGGRRSDLHKYKLIVFTRLVKSVK